MLNQELLLAQLTLNRNPLNNFIQHFSWQNLLQNGAEKNF